MKHFIKWIFGFVEVQIIQNNQSNLPIERFLNLCKNRKLQLFRLRKNSIGYCFSMSIRDFFQLKPIESKVHVHPRVIKRRGFPFWMLEWRRKKLYTGGFFLFLFLIWLMGNMIWSIDFEGCSYHTEEALLEFLEENGVYCGVFHQTLDYKRTEDLIRLRYHDISWVSIERVGTRLHIRIKESMPVTSVNKETEAAHVVAEIGGVVRSIITREGTPMVKAGDIVKKGDILISGIIDVKSDFDIPLSTHLVRADGTVVIDGTVPYFSVMELEYDKKNYIEIKQY